MFMPMRLFFQTLAKRRASKMNDFLHRGCTAWPAYGYPIDVRTGHDPRSSADSPVREILCRRPRRRRVSTFVSFVPVCNILMIIPGALHHSRVSHVQGCTTRLRTYPLLC